MLGKVYSYLVIFNKILTADNMCLMRISDGDNQITCCAFEDINSQ